MTRTVVITGASAGVGRAAAALFGKRGDNVGLLARARAGLVEAVEDVAKVGGTALAGSRVQSGQARAEVGAHS